MSRTTLRYLLFISCIFFISPVFAQKMTPEQVVQKQLETYNNRDIDGFMSTIADNVTFHNFSDGSVTMKGYDACKKFYADLFEASPKLHSTILKRTVFGNRVIDHEHITGRNGNDEALELVLIYEVNEEKIIKVTVLKEGE